MSEAWLVSGSWRLRHDEIRAGDATTGQAVPIPKGDPQCSRVVAFDLDAEAIPLALQDERGRTTHLVLGLDLDSAIMVRTPCDGEAALQRLMSRHHLRFNNNECDYRALPAPSPLGWSLDAASPGTLGLSLDAALTAGAIPGFARQFRKAPRQTIVDQQSWGSSSSDMGVLVVFAGRQADGDRQPVSSSLWRRDHDGVRRFETATGHATSHEAATRREEVSALVARLLGEPGHLRATARRIGIDLPIECPRTGHVFSARFETVLVESVVPALGQARRAVRCLRVSYERSRGGATPACIAARQDALGEAIVAWLVRRGIATGSLDSAIAEGDLA